MGVEIGRDVLALGRRLGLAGDLVERGRGDDLDRLPLRKASDLDIGNKIQAAATKQFYRLAHQRRIEQRAVAADANDAIELECLCGRLNAPEDIIQRAAFTSYPGPGAERRDGVVGRVGRGRHGDDVEDGAALQAVDEMREERLAAERFEDLAGQALRAEASLDDRADPHHTTERAVTRPARPQFLRLPAAEALHEIPTIGVAAPEAQ